MTSKHRSGIVARAGVLLLMFPALLQAQGSERAASSASGENRSTRSDRTALAIIFDEQHADESALEVHRRAREMPIEERFAFLSAWVLPSEDHPAFRVQAGFTPVHPPPLLGEFDEAKERRAPSGGEIVSPALDLIAAADSLNKLDDLGRQIASIPARSAEDQIASLALSALIDMARGDFDSAGARLDSLFAFASADNAAGESSRDALLLCVHKAAERPKTSRIVIGPAYRVVASYLEVYQREPWHRHFSGAFARAKQAAAQDDATAPPAESLFPATQWLAASRPLARHRGAGCPPALWRMERGEVENLVSHDDDYLYFPIPLRGDFDVECDVTGFGWRDSHLLVAGKWVAPVYDHESYDLGNIRGQETRIKFAPRLTKSFDTIHYRTAVRDGTAITWFNGRKIHEEPLPHEHEPWLAIRSSARHDGGVRNLRIAGDPSIPEMLRLSDSPELAGWVPYYDDFISIAMQDWRHHLGPDGQGEIHGRRRWDLPAGCHRERLLVYHRPMFEDGVIEYEFWYEPDRFAAHPVLDRLCFLLERDGVKVHWLTDGKFDRTGLPPDNVFEEPENRRGSGPLPLNAGKWNRARLTVTGDTVDLALNGELVYERRLETTNQRTFGLFHYADRTELRVRNVMWTGDWPRELPSLGGQELAIDETGFLDERLPKLTAVFAHDFGADGLPLDRFSVVKGDVAHHISAEPDGLHVQRPAAEGYRNVTVAPSLKVSGDFDITAAFDQLVTDPRGVGSSTIMLMALADNNGSDEGLLLRRQTLDRGGDQQLVQCVRVRRMNGDERRRYFAHQPVEAASGTLRLARRGDRLYYLFAETDSKHFRLVGQESFPADDLAMDGVRLVAQIHGDAGSTSVVWKNLSVHAERLSGAAVQGHNQLLSDLNRECSNLAKSFSHDFTRRAPDEAVFYRWTDQRPWRAQDQGLLIVAPGTDHWSSAGAALQKQIEGDFDVSIRFDPQRLDTPAEGLGSSVYLQLELADGNDTQISAILNKSSEGATEAIAQLRVPDGKGGYLYPRLGRISVRSANGLRLARRGNRMYCLVSPEDFDGQRIVAREEVGAQPVKMGGARILVHTGGSGRESRVLWKGLDVKADRITPEATAPKSTAPKPVMRAVPAPKPQPKSTVQSILDFFFP